MVSLHLVERPVHEVRQEPVNVAGVPREVDQEPEPHGGEEEELCEDAEPNVKDDRRPSALQWGPRVGRGGGRGLGATEWSGRTGGGS